MLSPVCGMFLRQPSWLMQPLSRFTGLALTVHRVDAWTCHWLITLWNDTGYFKWPSLWFLLLLKPVALDIPNSQPCGACGSFSLCIHGMKQPTFLARPPPPLGILSVKHLRSLLMGTNLTPCGPELRHSAKAQVGMWCSPPTNHKNWPLTPVRVQR